jgi:hypothetical protein
LIFTIQMGNRNPGDNRDNLTGLLPASLHVRAQRGKMASLARSLHSLEHTMGAEKRDKGRQGESFEPLNFQFWSVYLRQNSGTNRMRTV